MGKTMTFDQKLKCVDLFATHLVKRSDGFVVWAEGWSDARAAEVVKCKANQVANWRTQRGFKLSPAPKANALRKLPDLEKEMNDAIRSLDRKIDATGNVLDKRMKDYESRSDMFQARISNLIRRMDECCTRLDYLEAEKKSYISLAPKPPAAE